MLHTCMLPVSVCQVVPRFVSELSGSVLWAGFLITFDCLLYLNIQYMS